MTEKKFELNTGTIAIVAIVILIGIILYSGRLYDESFEKAQITVREEPLKKNVKFQLHPGEEYRYGYLFNNSTVDITYEILKGNGCTMVAIVESANRSEVCLDELGMDATGSNSTFANPSMLLFKPWMLALDERWRWNTDTYMVFDSTEYHISETSYRTVRTENYKGRMSYVVEIINADAPPEYYWIDMEKRVLLRILGDGYEIIMLKGLQLSD